MNIKNTDDKLQNEGKSRFNIADVIIIIISIALLTALALRIYNIFGIEKEAHRVRIQFKVSSIAEDSTVPSSNDILYLTSDDSKAGYVENISVSSAKVYAYTESGELVEASIPGKITLSGTLILDCTKAEGGFYIGGTQLLTVGNFISLYTPQRELQFEILSIESVT
jgi:hypothetical protein